MANRDFKIELDNVEMINGSDDLLKDTKVTKVTLTGENKLNSLNSTFENCTELTAIEGNVNLDGVSDMTEMTLNTPLDELKVTNPTEENIQTDNSLNQVTNVKIGGTKYAKGGVQDVVGSLEWTAENFTYEDAILDNVYTNSSSIEESKNITVSDTLEQKATSIEITGQTYENLVNGKATKNLLDEMSMQQTEGKPTQFTPHMEQPICLEYIEGQTYQNLIKGKGEYKLTDTYSHTWTESNNSIDNPPSMIEIPEIWGNTIQGYANVISSHMIKTSLDGINGTTVTVNSNGSFTFSDYNLGVDESTIFIEYADRFIQLKSNTTYSICLYDSSYNYYSGNLGLGFIKSDGSTDTLDTTWESSSRFAFTTDSTGKIFIFPWGCANKDLFVRIAEGEIDLSKYKYNEYDQNYIQSVGDLYVDENNEPILDDEGNEQYKIEINSVSKNLWDGKTYHKGRKSTNEQWGAIDGKFTANWDLKEPYGVQYDITASSMRGPTIPLEGLKAGKYINLTFKVTMPQYNPNITVHFFDNNKAYIGNISNHWDGGFSGNMMMMSDSSYTNLEGVYLGGLIPDGATCCEIVFALSQITDDVPYPQHIEITDIMVTVDDTLITSYRECEPQELNKTTILMPHQLKKIGSIKKYHQSTGDKWYPACSKLYYDYNAQKFFMKHLPTVEHNILEVLTTMNPYVDFTTRSYNNEDYYVIDIYFMVANNKFGILGRGGVDDITFMVKTTYPLPLLTGREYTMNWGTSNTTKLEGYIFNFVSPLSHGWTFALIIKASNFGGRTLDKDGVIDFFTTYPTSFVALKNQDYTMYLETSDNVYDIVETKILEKPSLDAYSPKTYITTNTEIQPSQMSITNKKADYIPLGLQPNKDYTLQLDSTGKDDKPITVNLGGAETTIQPINDTSKHHKVVVRTPGTLTTETLELSGEGVTVNDVMLFQGGEGVIKQDVDYIDGIQSIGELQDNGTYKIDVCTRPDCEYVYNKGVSNDTFIFENGSKEENNQLILTHNASGRITTTKSYTISPKAKILIKIVYADKAHASYGFKLILNNAMINQSKQDIIYDSISDKGYYLFEYENITNSDIISSICIGNYFGEYHIESIAIVYDDSKYSQSIYLPRPLCKKGNAKDKFYWDDDKGHYCIEQNIGDNLEVLSSPNIIDLTEMNQKFSFDTYLPNIYVDVTNLPLQPYKLQLEDDTVRYKSTIEPSTLYTVQFNCVSKLTTRLTLDLGGTRKTVDPIIGVNHVQITTLSELTSDRLFLIGTGIIVKEVIVNKGYMAQYPKYFDGEQSVGELQTDGSYKIVIKTNEGFTVTIRTSSPLTKLDKIYWNDTEKRYEIDRNGAIEVPTVEGDIINLPRLYQKVDTTISISTDNIEPSKIDISYKDIH